MTTRRSFLRTSALAAAVLPGLRPGARSRGDLAMVDDASTIPVAPRGDVEDVSRDEQFWREVRLAFRTDRSMIHLNNGGVCPAPGVVQDSERAYREESSRWPFYAYEGLVRPQLEAIRGRLADAVGCTPDELAFTRNTSEGMAICQFGIDLRPGDEIVTTEHDYPRMIEGWEQRVRRDGIVLRRVPVPVPLDDPGELVDRIGAALGPRTRLVMCCHVVDLTGQILPVRAIADRAHARGVPVLVDAAQSFGHFPFTLDELGADYFATSLHKWLMGPHGTGFLVVRRERIGSVSPLIPPDAPRDDIRKLEDVGTHSPAPFLALAEALAFQEGITLALKTARLRVLRDRWIEALLATGRVTTLTHLATAGALATVDVAGLDPLALRNHLWDRHRIRVRPIDRPGVRGIRVSPSLHNSLQDVDTFVDVIHDVVRDGLPST